MQQPNPYLDQSKNDPLSVHHINSVEDPETKEMLWERRMYLTGRTAYAESMAKAEDRGLEASDTTSGIYAMGLGIKRAITIIKDIQQGMITSKRDFKHRAGMLAVPADTLALVVLRFLIDKTYSCDDHTMGIETTYACQFVGDVIETEARFRHWLEQSKAEAKERFEKKKLDALAQAETLPFNAKVPKSKAELYMAERGIEPRHRRSILRTIQNLAVEEWDDDGKKAIAAEILLPVAEGLSDIFEVYLHQFPDRHVKMIRMRAEFRDLLVAKEYRIARQQVVRKPMLTPPAPWVRK